MSPKGGINEQEKAKEIAENGPVKFQQMAVNGPGEFQ
jgi:hypothetical protein